MTDKPPIDMKHELSDAALLVWLGGEIDFSGSPGLRAELMALMDRHQPERLIIDLTTVPYMDSSGIATFVELLQWQRHRNRSLVLTGVQSKVHRLLEITRLDQLFTIAESIESAQRM